MDFATIDVLPAWHNDPVITVRDQVFYEILHEVAHAPPWEDACVAFDFVKLGVRGGLRSLWDQHVLLKINCGKSIPHVRVINPGAGAKVKFQVGPESRVITDFKHVFETCAGNTNCDKVMQAIQRKSAVSVWPAPVTDWAKTPKPEESPGHKAAAAIVTLSAKPVDEATVAGYASIMSELADLAGVPPSSNMLTTAETKRFLIDTGFMHYNDVMGRCGFGDIFEIAKMNEIQRFEFFGEIGIQFTKPREIFYERLRGIIMLPRQTWSNEALPRNCLFQPCAEIGHLYYPPEFAKELFMMTLDKTSELIHGQLHHQVKTRAQCNSDDKKLLERIDEMRKEWKDPPGLGKRKWGPLICE